MEEKRRRDQILASLHTDGLFSAFDPFSLDRVFLIEVNAIISAVGWFTRDRDQRFPSNIIRETGANGANGYSLLPVLWKNYHDWNKSTDYMSHFR